MYSGQHGPPPPPPNYPYGAPPPYYHPQQPYYQPRYKPHRSGLGCCFRCICCIYFLLFILIFGFIASLFIIFSLYQPKIPYYTIQDFDVTTFDFQPDKTVKSDFLVTIRAENPNTKIGFIYGSDNSVIVSFEGKILSSGKMPEFHQDHLNVKTIKVQLTGKTSVESNLRSDFENGEHHGIIPLLVQVKVPVTLVFDNIPMRQIIFHVNCHMSVDDLRPNKKARIISSVYTFGFGLE